MFGIVRGVFRGISTITRTLGQGARFLGRTAKRVGRGTFNLGKKIFGATTQQINPISNIQSRENSIATFDRTLCKRFSPIIKSHPKKKILKRRHHPRIKIPSNIFMNAEKRFLGLKKKQLRFIRKSSQRTSL